MSDEELKKKCTERAKIFQQAMESCHSTSPIDCIEWFADRIAELEAQIEEMKCLLNEIYSEYGFSELVKIRNDLPIEIQEVIKEMKEND